MTAAAPAVDAGVPTSGPVITRDKFQMQPIRALKALRKLIADKEDTYQAFEVVRALTGNSITNNYRRMMQSEEGGRQAYLSVELEPILCDKAWVASFAPGTVGAAYREFIAARDLSAAGLADVSRTSQSEIDALHPLAWMGRRMRDTHDIWHILTGYNTDALGEGCVLAFSYAQTGNLGLALMAAAGSREFSRARTGLPFAQAVWQAYQNGRKAEWLPAQDYQALFAEPLEAARKRLKIARPTIYESIPAQYRDRFPDAVEAPLAEAA